MNSKKVNILLILMLFIVSVLFVNIQIKANSKYGKIIENVKNELIETNENYLDIENDLSDSMGEYDKLVINNKKLETSLLEMKDKHDQVQRQYDLLLMEAKENNLAMIEIDDTLKSYIWKLNKIEDGFVDTLSFDKEIRNSYHNRKYDYSISFPNEWVALSEPPAGDGVFLYNHNNFDIRVYGGYRLEPPNYPQNVIDDNITNGYSSEEILSNTGDVGIFQIKTIKEKTLIRYYLIGKDRFCCFYANFDNKYYSNNQDVIIEIAKTIKVYK